MAFATTTCYYHGHVGSSGLSSFWVLDSSHCSTDQVDNIAVEGDSSNSPIYPIAIQGTPQNSGYYPVPVNGISNGQYQGTVTNVPIEGTTTVTNSTSSPMTIDNPVFDLFAGAILFYVVMWGIVWFFKR